ncbi:putative non-specific serine/threonine protein kinase [Helianthus annuus]|nr:putative non-specific serine/threonine protein kinase [Helianthus annuus]
MNATSWRFDGDDCSLHMVSEVPKPSQEANASIGCDCNIGNHTDDCHVSISLTLKSTLPSRGWRSGKCLSPFSRGLRDFAYNYLSGTIPPEWGSTTLQEISLLGNRLTGSIPPELGNITTLTKLNFEANQLSGTIPSELGRLTNLKTLILSSNRLTGRLPTTLGQLGNLTEFRIKENNFSGSIPDFIQNWRLLTRLEMVASGLTGPIPSNISLLENLTDLILRNCNISGEIPEYIWLMRELEVLDLSFNRLVGRISNNIVGWTLRFVFLTANMLSGDIPDTLLLNGATIDFSYNNFTWQGPDQATCRQNQ